MAHVTAFEVDALAGRPALPGSRRAVAALAGATWLLLLGGGWWGVLHLAPDQATLRLAGRTLTVGHLHARILGNATLLLALLPFALWVDYVAAGWERSSLRRLVMGRSPSVKTDLAVLVLGQARVLDLLGHLMMLGVSLVSGLWVREGIRRATGFAVDPTALPLPLQVAVYFYGYTFFDYWTHRVDHSRWFWPLHRYHHSAEEFCVATSARQHPAAFAGVFFINVPLAVLGAPAEVMLYVNILVTAIGFLIHSNIDSDWGWIGRWAVQSPNHHRLHHKLDMSEPTSSFSMAPIWDRLFGTWRAQADATVPIGVSREYRHGLWVAPDLLRDYADFWRGVMLQRFRP